MNKKTIIRIVAALCILSIPVYNLCKMHNKNKAPESKANVDLSAVEEINQNEVNDVMQNVGGIDADEASGKNSHSDKGKSQFTPEEIFEKVQNDETSYPKIYSDALICGDSLVESLQYYSVLNSENVIGKVSASLYDLQDISDQIISYHPKTLVLHYGQNHVENGSDTYVNNFVSFYKPIVENFKKQLPGTRIFISSIFPANEHGLADSPYLSAIPAYNEGLKKMCQELGVEYLDNSPLFEGDLSFYEPDGVHMTKVFYTDHWLPFMAYELNLI